MNALIRPLIFSLLTLQPGLTLAGPMEGGPAKIRDLMSAEQYKAMGLEQLTTDQRDLLAAWLHDYAIQKNAASRESASSAPPVLNTTVATVATGSKTDDESPGSINASISASISATGPSDVDEDWGFSNPPRTKSAGAEVLRANIEGHFRGWSGKTRFHLDNGQVWVQRRSGHFNYRGSARRVEISKGRWGLFEMRLIDADRSIGVSRLK